MKRSKTTGKASSRTASSPHGRLSDMEAPKVRSTVRASYDDDEPFVNNHETGNIRVTIRHEILTSPKAAQDDHSMETYLQID